MSPDDTEQRIRDLKSQSQTLADLIAEAQRVHREVEERLRAVRRDAHATTRERRTGTPERRTRPRTDRRKR